MAFLYTGYLKWPGSVLCYTYVIFLLGLLILYRQLLFNFSKKIFNTLFLMNPKSNIIIYLLVGFNDNCLFTMHLS